MSNSNNANLRTLHFGNTCRLHITGLLSLPSHCRCQLWRQSVTYLKLWVITFAITGHWSQKLTTVLHLLLYDDYQFVVTISKHGKTPMCCGGATRNKDAVLAIFSSCHICSMFYSSPEVQKTNERWPHWRRHVTSDDGHGNRWLVASGNIPGQQSSPSSLRDTHTHT